MPDKFAALWVSHSSITDFLQCPRAYYLKNIYKNPESGRKFQITAPALSLGSAVHEVVEALSEIPTQERFRQSLLEKFSVAWKQYSGKLGGFSSLDHEAKYRAQGEEMIRTIMNNPGPLKNLSVKIKGELPQYWLSEAEEIILCGKIDWLEYLPETDSVHVIDFKTSKQEERADSLQLPIYHLLVTNTQKRVVTKASYWYLRLHENLVEKALPDLTQAHETVLQIAKKMKTAKKLGVFKCPHDGCFACKPLEQVVRGEAELVGVGSYNRDIYYIPESSQIEQESEIL